jgi:hypothetical protein
MSISLTQRDLAIIRFIAVRRSALLEHIAAYYFAQDPFDEEWNLDPMKACCRRLGALSRAGYVRLGNDYDGRQRRRVVTLGAAAVAIAGDRCDRRRVPARNRAHHIWTQEAIRRLEGELSSRGARIAGVSFDQDVRANELTGKMTKRGDKFPVIPDAVCRVEVRGNDGVTRLRNVAVEYVTSKYTDADTREKRESFRRFDGAHWFADNATTAARVQRLTGASCSVLT